MKHINRTVTHCIALGLLFLGIVASVGAAAEDGKEPAANKHCGVAAGPAAGG